MAGGSTSDVGSGGMTTKVMAARIAVAAGCHLCIAAGREAHPLRRIESGARCTWFLAEASPVAVRKQWIAGMLKPAGELAVDAGAANALRDGKSLLPAGVVEVKGRFDRGDAVVVRDPAGVEIARGLAAYSSADAGRIRGRRSTELESLLGYRGRDEMIHRDDLVLT
jgi:glutamate 5-kinase